MTQQIENSRLQDRALHLVEAAQKAGADAADAVAVTSQSLSVAVREGKVETTDRSEGDGLSLRVFVGQRSASISTNREEDIEALAQRAVQMATVSPQDPYAGLADQDRLLKEIPLLDLIDDTEVSATMLQDVALRAEEAGMAVQGTTKSGGASAGWGLSGMVLATSHGFVGAYQRSRSSFSMVAVAGEGTNMERDYDYDSRTYWSDLDSAEKIGQSAGERAVRRMNPRKLETCKVPVFYDPRVASSLLGHFAGAISGAAIARGTSFLKDQLGKQVFSKAINITDNPYKPRGAGTAPFDGEGTAAPTLRLIEDGVLTSWLLDSASARELGLTPNGRARRSGSTTIPGTTNLTLSEGDLSREQLLQHFGSGLLITEMIGSGANGVTGDYSRGASGFWVENGEIAYPVSEITIASNMRDMFMNMTAASDLDQRYAVAAPTLAVEGMTIAGN
ncbi:TldD/PmbA family protein [Polycladidibacter stylochi]|uniref:TldD/PmbA family protein n=1 Tax=Polycladidibacter stylochi TaxID=1807766 RepID=UPI00082ADFB9|nr:metallopeptidase TldD-related protein [Pseudovibrio stylochi]